MPVTVIVGTQWGDEGKGRVTDYLAQSADWIVRYQGGNNAGHTVVAGGRTFKLHLLPSGIVHPGKTSVLANGVVIDPVVLMEEIDGLAARGVETSALWVSDRAHVILPYHKLLDQLEEKARGPHRIGTTGRGVGPAYVDKVGRQGVRIVDLIEPATFKARLDAILPMKNRLIELYGGDPLTIEEIAQTYAPLAERIAPMVADTGLLLHEAVESRANVLFEGAQGTLLDVEHGTYPYVTSSSPTACSVAGGAGIAPRHIDRVFGVAKAYTTRVGEGPFPSEALNEAGSYIREKGREYGTTTGRPRRIGWFDAAVVRHAARLNGLDRLVVTCLDVLGGLDTIQVCVAYELDGERIDHIPASLEDYSRCQPIYESLPGWQEEIGEARRLEELPPQARAYVERLCELVGVPAAMVSVGPDREAAIVEEALA